MGEVYFARRKKDQKLYALKTLKAWGQEIDKKFIKAVASFRRESLVWVTLGKHKNIVQAFWFNLDERYRPFLIMEYVEGDPRYGVSLWHWLPGGKGFFNCKGHAP
jgi:serine/threonine protein kinase